LWIDQYEDMSGQDSDIYQVAAQNQSGTIGLFSKPGSGGYLSSFHAMMDNVRNLLGDNNPYFYQLDNVPQYKWNGTELSKLVKRGLRSFNGHAPMVTTYTFDTLP